VAAVVVGVAVLADLPDLVARDVVHPEVAVVDQEAVVVEEDSTISLKRIKVDYSLNVTKVV
jgi:hypothetical protein